MSFTFDAQMPKRPPGQKHSKPKQSDNYGFLRSLTGDKCADVNLTWVWNDLDNKTEAGGGAAFGLHYADPWRNGYKWWRVGNRVERIPEGRRRSSRWTVAEVRRWRRGPHMNSPRPHMYSELLTYVKKRGGTIVGELKSQAFTLPWVMEQLVHTAKRRNHAPWFKALANMKRPAEKCAAAVGAGGQFALIFGKFVKGRGARLAKGQEITATWPVKPTRIW